MLNASAKPLTDKVFRYPIKFIDGVGIGAVEDKFGVWRSDGSMVLPPQYKNARFIANDERIVLYQNIGLKNWLLLVEPQTGKTLINTGRYDGISSFYGNYALISLGDKVGLVDTNGVEIIAPMSFENDTYNLMDSLDKARWRHQVSSKENAQNIAFPELPITMNYYTRKGIISPDSLGLSNALRNRVWHYLLETQAETVIERADIRKIQRARAFKTYDQYQLYQEVTDYKRQTNTLKYLFADSIHISFTLTSDSAAKSIFKNYWRTKTGWQTKRLSDILNLNRDNVLKINGLMREKLRKLEDKDIDCGESTSFVERTQNTFLSHAKGISFYFTSDKRDEEDYSAFHYVPVLLTWSELKPFLTPQ